MKPSLYRSLMPVHRWTGLTVGFVILFIAITGAAMVFRPQLEPIMGSDLLTAPACASRASVDLLLANASAARPAATLDYVRLVAGQPGEARIPAAMVRFTDQTFVYLNPCSGAALGQRHRYGGLFGTLELLHRFRFIDNGSVVTGTSVILFALLLILGGVALWWPASRRGWASAWRLDPRLTGQARSTNRHKVVGLVAAPIVLMSALSGLPQALDWYRAGLYTITGSAAPAPLPKSGAPANGALRLPMEQLWQRAQTIAPAPQDMLMHVPRKPRAPVDMYLIEHDAPHPNARTYLNFDAYTGAVLSYTPYRANSAGHKLYFFLLSLHTGHVGGLAGQLLLLLGALCVPVLAWTGIGSYLRRRRQAGITCSAVNTSLRHPESV
jgi:uncharacterized iron-regulated membrane protein